MATGNFSYVWLSEGHGISKEGHDVAVGYDRCFLVNLYFHKVDLGFALYGLLGGV